MYESVIVVGNGSLLTRCLQWLICHTTCRIECLETGVASFSGLSRLCQNNKIPYDTMTTKEQLNKLLAPVSRSTLVLSIHNSLFFTSQCLDNKSLKLVNFHNSLLPRHPGRNSPSWAIYEMDKLAGITWHEVVKAVDRGCVISQESLSLTSEMTGITLTRACADLGFECFKNILPSLLNNDYVSLPQNNETYKMHLSHEVPNNGVFDQNWTIVKMSAFLRSLDYGIYQIFDKPKVNLNGQWHVISSYTVADGCHPISFSPNKDGGLTFCDDKTAICLKVVPVNER